MPPFEETEKLLIQNLINVRRIWGELVHYSSVNCSPLKSAEGSTRAFIYINKITCIGSQKFTSFKLSGTHIVYVTGDYIYIYINDVQEHSVKIYFICMHF